MPNQRLPLLALAAGVLLLAACDEARDLAAREGSSEGTCSTCHGFPPAAPHPQSESCFACHPESVDRNNELIPGGAHANGRRDVTFGHPAGYLAVHSGDALADIQVCQICHGEGLGGGTGSLVSCNACHASLGYASWQTNCTFCHGIRSFAFSFEDLALAAPPFGVRGGTEPTDPRVGAHERHVGRAGALSSGFDCGACHPLSGTLDHLDGQAQIQFGSLASTGGATPVFAPATQTCSSVYCHGATLEGGTVAEPRWTGAIAACDACHGVPPPTGQHAAHGALGLVCADCHAGYTDATVNPALHVNGVRDVSRNGVTVQGWACGTCHAL